MNCGRSCAAKGGGSPGQVQGGGNPKGAHTRRGLGQREAPAMGGEWIQYNVMKERTDILHLRNWSRFLEAKGDGTLLATEESETGETSAKAACETPVLPVTIKESSGNMQADTPNSHSSAKQRVETLEDWNRELFTEISAVAPSTCASRFVDKNQREAYDRDCKRMVVGAYCCQFRTSHSKLRGVERTDCEGHVCKVLPCERRDEHENQDNEFQCFSSHGAADGPLDRLEKCIFRMNTMRLEFSNI